MSLRIGSILDGKKVAKFACGVPCADLEFFDSLKKARLDRKSVCWESAKDDYKSDMRPGWKLSQYHEYNLACFGIFAIDENGEEIECLEGYLNGDESDQFIKDSFGDWNED